MKTTIKTLATMLATASTAFAASGAETEGSGILTALFLGFGALVIAFQLFPGLLLFGSMIKGLFTSGAKEPGK